MAGRQNKEKVDGLAAQLLLLGLPLAERVDGNHIKSFILHFCLWFAFSLLRSLWIVLLNWNWELCLVWFALLRGAPWPATAHNRESNPTTNPQLSSSNSTTSLHCSFNSVSFSIRPGSQRKSNNSISLFSFSKRKDDWICWFPRCSHQSVHLPQIQIKLTHRFVFVYNSWLAAYTVIILSFHPSINS